MPKPEEPEAPAAATGFTYIRPGAEREAETETEPEPQATATSAEPEPETEPEADAEDDDYPDDGTIPDVKEWIGEDLGRARAALDREQDRPSGPRVTLVEYLNDLLEDDDS